MEPLDCIGIFFQGDLKLDIHTLASPPTLKNVDTSIFPAGYCIQTPSASGCQNTLIVIEADWLQSLFC